MKISELSASTLNPDYLQELDTYINSLEDKQQSVIKILHRAQEIFGYLPEALQLYIARALNMPASRINGIVTFYSYFHEEPSGKYEISVCMGTACFVKGSQEILDAFRTHLKLENSDITEDGLFSIRDVRCIGACGLAPVVMINKKIIGHVNAKDVPSIIETYRKEQEV